MSFFTYKKRNRQRTQLQKQTCRTDYSIPSFSHEHRTVRDGSPAPRRIGTGIKYTVCFGAFPPTWENRNSYVSTTKHSELSKLRDQTWEGKIFILICSRPFWGFVHFPEWHCVTLLWKHQFGTELIFYKVQEFDCYNKITFQKNNFTLPYQIDINSSRPTNFPCVPKYPEDIKHKVITSFTNCVETGMSRVAFIVATSYIFF